MKFVNNVKKDKILLKKIEKTKEEKYPNLEDLKEKRILEEKREKLKEFKQQVYFIFSNIKKKKNLKKKEEAILSQKKKEEEEAKSYKHIMKEENMTSNKVFLSFF